MKFEGPPPEPHIKIPEKPKEGLHAGGGGPLKESWTEAERIGQERKQYEKEMEKKIEEAKQARNAELHQKLVEERERKREEFHAQEVEIAKEVAKSKKYELGE